MATKYDMNNNTTTVFDTSSDNCTLIGDYSTH